MATPNINPSNPPKKPQPAAQSSSGEQLDELRYMHQIYQNQYASIASEISTRLDALKNFQNTQQTLENIDAVVNKNLLLGLGGGAYASGTITNQNSVVVNVGGGFLVEKDIDSAKGYVAKAIDNTTNAINQLTKDRRELERVLLEIAYRIEAISH
ncbi:MAG: prefoldin subunit alpha [Candidatus Micrarchaeales archaeon]|nr:prefoldin subunit alpha [Candidatus Micrarchaeales archaeon]